MLTFTSQFTPALGASNENDLVSYPFEEMQHGSLSMRSVLFGS